jgi:DNA-binding HxlR family transcriptional regulator
MRQQRCRQAQRPKQVGANAVLGGIKPCVSGQVFGKRYAAIAPPRKAIDSEVEALVHELIGRVADKWTLDVLDEKGELRFTRIGENVPGISQKMLTQTLHQMERDGLVVRTIFPVVPPKVEYKLTELGYTLSAAFCGVWGWASDNLIKVEQARQDFDKRAEATAKAK